MSPKKITFFVILGIVILSVIIAIYYISHQSAPTKVQSGSIKIWITEGTTEGYQTLLDGFRKYAPEYAKTEITIEKQSNDPEKYSKFLLETLVNGNGPDIFMLHSGEDMSLESRIEPIPSTAIDLSGFDKRYDDIFSGLLSSTGVWGEKVMTIKWIPIGYETLGVFYNKSLIRTVPTDWESWDRTYQQTRSGTYPSNLGLWPIYTPNMVDLLPLWLQSIGISSYTGMLDGKSALSNYLAYATIPVSMGSDSQSTTSSDTPTDPMRTTTVSQITPTLTSEKLTTLDAFIRGDIAMIIWYPSLVLDLEKSVKRMGENAKSSIILTDRIPQMKVGQSTNIGRYTYLAVSRLTTNPIVSAKFMAYLMTPDAQRILMQEYPYLIPAQSEFYETARDMSLSPTLARTRLGAFIPEIGEQVFVFEYGLKSRWERYMRDAFIGTTTPDLETLTTRLSHDIKCELESSLMTTTSSDCENK
jgi:ABC-type glycerol-3-phosphate transport system substrate-binding protein